MNSFHSGPVRQGTYPTLIQNERRNLAEMFGPHDFFNPSNVKVYDPGEPGYLLNRFRVLQAFGGAMPADDFDHLQGIKVNEEPEWVLFELQVTLSWKGKMLYDNRQFIVHIPDDNLALMYKLKFK